MRLLSGIFMLLAGCAYVSQGELLAELDRDLDGYFKADCVGAECLNGGWDCDDEIAGVYPGAADLRGDGCDSDCGWEPDSDGDDWPDSVDCAPDDATIFPCSSAELPGDGIDSDCDGSDGVRADACPMADPRFPDVDSDALLQTLRDAGCAQ